VKFHSPSSVLGAVLALAAALLLASCGGGGASGNPDVTGALQISPTGGTIYAGVPYTINVQGGRTPYTLTSSEPGLVPVPASIDGHSFTVVANNPGVIDIGLQPGQLPVRSVFFTVRSGDGQVVVTGTGATGFQVGQNFLTGYGITFSPITCPIGNAAGSTTAPDACAGGQSVVRMSATFNGNLAGDRQFQFQVLKGHFQFVFPQTGVLGNTVTTVSDHSGNVQVILQADSGIATEIAVLRVIDLATGVYDDHAFVIQGAGGTGTLTLVPPSITLTGNLTTDCGNGTSNVLVFDGTPPYTAISTNPQQIILQNTSSTAQPGIFTVTVNATPPPCPTGNIVITDSAGVHATETVTSSPGSGKAPTPAAFTVAPTDLSLGCGESGSVSVVGGTGSYTTATGSTNVTAVVSGNTVTITRLNSGNTSGSTPVSITDGANVGVVTVTNTLTCP